MKVDRVTANHSLSSTAIQQKFQHSLSLLSLSQDVTARQKFIHLQTRPGEQKFIQENPHGISFLFFCQPPKDKSREPHGGCLQALGTGKRMNQRLAKSHSSVIPRDKHTPVKKMQRRIDRRLVSCSLFYEL